MGLFCVVVVVIVAEDEEEVVRSGFGVGFWRARMHWVRIVSGRVSVRRARTSKMVVGREGCVRKCGDRMRVERERRRVV